MTVSITCPVCSTTSHNPDDVSAGWCEHCRAYTGAVVEMVDRAPWGLDRPMYFDKQGHPVTMARWAWLSDHDRFEEYRRVAEDTIDLYWVSTVWIGLDLGFAGGPPLIFETAVFLQDTVEDMGMNRYASEDEARAGHEAVVAEIRELARTIEDSRRGATAEGES